MPKTQQETKQIHIHGRRWFQRTYGNTYNTCQIWINGEAIHKTGETLGYDSYYNQAATEWLDKNGHLPGLEHYSHGGTESLWRYCERKKIKLVDEVDDVSRERDL